MFSRLCVTRFFKTAVRLSPGLLLYGSSCASDVRDTLTAAGLDFIGDTAGDVLRTILPIGDILAGM